MSPRLPPRSSIGGCVWAASDRLGVREECRWRCIARQGIAPSLLPFSLGDIPLPFICIYIYTFTLGARPTRDPRVEWANPSGNGPRGPLPFRSLLYLISEGNHRVITSLRARLALCVMRKGMRVYHRSQEKNNEAYKRDLTKKLCFFFCSSKRAIKISWLISDDYNRKVLIMNWPLAIDDIKFYTYHDKSSFYQATLCTYALKYVYKHNVLLQWATRRGIKTLGTHVTCILYLLNNNNVNARCSTTLATMCSKMITPKLHVRI